VAEADRGRLDHLLLLALSRPQEALAEAQAVIASQPGPYAASVAHQTVGIVARDTGDVEAGVRELRTALRLAQRSGSVEREGDVLATLGAALVLAGRTTAGLAAFDQAVRNSSGVLIGRVLHRRGVVLWTLGRYEAALKDLRRAVTMLRRADDRIWTARALTARGLVYASMGSPSRADADFAVAEGLFAETNQDLESAHAVLNRAMSSFSLGDLPTALSRLDEAARRYQRLKAPAPPLRITRCAVLLAAGLAGDALAEASAAVRDIDRFHGRSTWKAELLLMAAGCALAAAQPQAALDWARAAHRLFRSQQRTWWQVHAAATLAEAKYAAGQTSPRLLDEAGRAAAALEAAGSGEAARMHLLAGRVALDLGRRGDAEHHLVSAAQGRRQGTALSRACGWLSEALRAEATGDWPRMFASCREGLKVLDEHRFTLGASELRAQATAHGTELAALAQRHAARAHRPRRLLTWSERWRATALVVPPVQPLADKELNSSLAALREVMRRLDQARTSPTAGATPRERLQLEREQSRLERAVRACALRAPGIAYPYQATISVPDLLDEIRADRLVEIADIDGVLHVLICGEGKVRQFTAGRVADASRAADFARFALRRMARSRPDDDVHSALAILEATGPRLQDALLGPAAGHLGDGHIVVVPPGRLHTVPWGLIPALRDRAVSVVPSAAAWMRARATAPPAHRHVTLARGPGLVTDGAEVATIARFYDDVTLLTGQGATARKVLQALDGAWLAHIAAHGSYRADSPLFSSLRMEDGPLTVYDFEQLRRAPYRLVLSSCDSGVLAPAGADELLGLVTSLLPLGTAGITAAIVPLNDQAAVPVMLGLHRHLRAGHSLAESVHAVRRRLTDDPIERATAVSLVALGAA
jgi:tetratricopeptide (TPR) repeat protein